VARLGRERERDHGVMADDELDNLYSVPPEEFTAERTRLSAAAKRRGDTAAAKLISASRKPTTAAWIVNRLALGRKDTRRRLEDLGDRLRAAHAAMDGPRVRELSAEQHKLVDELTRAALDTADVKNPSSTLRDDLTSTLQAAVADPDVRARLGRLTRPEQWSGFGGFGDATPVFTTTRSATGNDEPKRSQPATRPARDAAAPRRLEKLKAAVAAAERAKAEADDTLCQRQADRDAARRRRDEARAALATAERAVDRAQADYDEAERASRTAAESVTKAKAHLNEA